MQRMARVMSWYAMAWAVCASDLYGLGIDGIFERDLHN